MLGRAINSRHSSSDHDVDADGFYSKYSDNNDNHVENYVYEWNSLVLPFAKNNIYSNVGGLVGMITGLCNYIT